MMIIVLALLLIAAIYTDLRRSRIPNWLTFSAMGISLLMQTWVGGLYGALFSLAGLGVGMGLFLLPYACRAIGAGDVKLMAAIGSLVGPSGVLSVAALSVLAGGLYALGAMTYQWGVVATSRKLAFATYGAVVSGGSTGVGDLQLPFKLRYGLAIAAGTLLVLLGFSPFGG
ncbi:MAG: A24 family peptidase [Nitrospira sp.]|nr:A24 family peptidase [Nitrospira sp.]MDH4369626.1 A24 family peptidase [Nitrospira sp.]MDH5497145.1 A24 family peptidase [Nitrospira sp.]MDH5727071.1 A24 family peptidase [Nitrospira sp.]